MKFDRARNRNSFLVERVPKLLYESFHGDRAVSCIYLAILEVNHVHLNCDIISVNRSVEPVQTSSHYTRNFSCSGNIREKIIYSPCTRILYALLSPNAMYPRVQNRAKTMKGDFGGINTSD